MMNTLPAGINWVRPELLADQDTWSAYDTAIALWSERSRTPSADGIACMCRDAIAFLDSGSAPDHVVARWRPAYARVLTALGMA